MNILLQKSEKEFNEHLKGKNVIFTYYNSNYNAYTIYNAETIKKSI